MTSEEAVTNLGIQNLRSADQVNVGGASQVTAMQSAAMAIRRSAGLDIRLWPQKHELNDNAVIVRSTV